MKQIIAATFLAIIVMTVVPFIPKQRAHAIIGFEAESAAAYQLALEIAQEVLKKRFFDMVVDQIVVWIQGGGRPLFITDWNGFLAQYGNIVTGDLIGQLGLGAVCSPFGFQLQLAVMQPPRFMDQVSCTLDSIVGNMANFYNNFRSGGFIAYREMWQSQNNFYGALLLTMDEKKTRISDARYVASQRAQAGGGYLGTEKCDDRGNCYITTPGTAIGAAAAKVMGADIDYIVNAKSLAAYVAAISDALINRVIREGVQGLQGVVVTNAPPIGYVPTKPKGAKPCSGLAGEALASCEAMIGMQTGNLMLVRTSYVQGIDVTLAPLLDAQRNLLSLQISQQVLVSRLSELNTCQIGRSTSGREVTVTELTFEQKTLADLNVAIIELQITTTPLINAKNTIANVQLTDLIALQALMAPVYQLLNQRQAEAYQGSIKVQYDAQIAKVAKRLPEIQTSLIRCINS